MTIDAKRIEELRKLGAERLSEGVLCAMTNPDAATIYGAINALPALLDALETANASQHPCYHCAEPLTLTESEQEARAAAGTDPDPAADVKCRACLAAEIERLREALTERLTHTRDCTWDNAIGDGSDHCDCGLREARAVLNPQPEEVTRG